MTGQQLPITNNRMGETAFNKTKEGIGNIVAGFIDVFVEIPAGIVGEISKKVATIGLLQSQITSDLLLSNAIKFVTNITDIIDNKSGDIVRIILKLQSYYSILIDLVKDSNTQMETDIPQIKQAVINILSILALPALKGKLMLMGFYETLFQIIRNIPGIDMMLLKNKIDTYDAIIKKSNKSSLTENELKQLHDIISSSIDNIKTTTKSSMVSNKTHIFGGNMFDVDKDKKYKNHIKIQKRIQEKLRKKINTTLKNYKKSIKNNKYKINKSKKNNLRR